jgi:hypothetical protein
MTSSTNMGAGGMSEIGAKQASLNLEFEVLCAYRSSYLGIHIF